MQAARHNIVSLDKEEHSRTMEPPMLPMSSGDRAEELEVSNAESVSSNRATDPDQKVTRFDEEGNGASEVQSKMLEIPVQKKAGMPVLLGKADVEAHKAGHVHFKEEYADNDGDRGESEPLFAPPQGTQSRYSLQRGDVSTVSARSMKSNRSHSFWSHGTSFATDVEEDEEGLERSRPCSCNMGCCAGSGSCHICYISAFLCFLIIFPLFLKWMIIAPKPPEYWHQEYPKFPLLADWLFVRDDIGASYKLTVSDIPTSPTGCNHTCATQGGSLRASAEMNFDVTLQLDAPALMHTAYPVLFASNDFEEWWVAADRRHSYPTQYFPSHQTVGEKFHYVTDKCTRPPQIDIGAKVSPTSLRSEEPSKVPGYVLACITWNSSKVAQHRGTKVLNLTTLADFCDAVGGVCGMPCQTGGADYGQLPGCRTDGTLDVDNAKGTLAGVKIPNAGFTGSVSLRACLPGSGDCIISPQQLSQWRCHKCQNSSSAMNLEYDSLPRMQVTIKNVVENMKMPGSMAPQAYIFTSPVADKELRPHGLLENPAERGQWKGLYDDELFPLPVPLYEVPELPKDSVTTLPPTLHVDESKHAMRHVMQNRINIKPNWCFGKRGPLYLVACAVNSSTHLDKFQFDPGQRIAPPPFNDRCLTVAGRCARACTERQRTMRFCDGTGHVEQDRLVDRSETKDNRILPVYLFVWTLLFGFSVRVLSYFPGLFTPYRRAKYYTPEMTGELKYIAIVTPSGGETKACVLRNLVGSLSTLPSDCRCPFHVLYADEGHRHPHKIMFRAFVSVMAHVPHVCMNSKGSKRGVKTGYKEKNLKAFTTQWVESTKKFKLEDCNVEKIVKNISQLREQLPDTADKICKLEAKIDALCGAAALQMMQKQAGWPKAQEGPPGSPGMIIRDLELAIQQLKAELICGEKAYDGFNTSEGPDRDMVVPAHLDDHADYGWTDPAEATAHPTPLYNLHYVARAKPLEDERKLKVQHVAQGIVYYAIPKDEHALEKKTWLQWRSSAQEFYPGHATLNSNKYLVPLRTSRGKAGGLNFAENYLFDFHCRYENPRAVMDPVRYKHALFSIADARHQFQPDFLWETVPYFFRSAEDLNPRVAFTQCPQYFQEMPDESDYLDTNNSNFFRLGCMLRNCCGGVSSCGTNGTWLVRDRRAGRSGTNTMWEMELAKDMDQGFSQVVERRFFHESCKVEDTASSLDRVVKGKYSQYINMRLSYGMAKAPTDYLAAIQRWAEGGVVLAWQTFLGTERGVYMIWITLLLFLGFIVSVFFAVHGSGNPYLITLLCKLIIGDDKILIWSRRQTDSLAVEVTDFLRQPASSLDAFKDMFFSVLMWIVTLALGIVVISVSTFVSHILHHTTCCGRRKPARRTRFPTNLAQWARLAITVDNLTYFLWFWTAFFWIGFNYYMVFTIKEFHFEPKGMMIFSWMVAALVWCLILSASARNTKAESQSSNEVFILSLTNIWRTTQLFYITAPLTVYSIIMGTLDYNRHRMFGEDISYWVGGDRGAVSKSIVQYWTLLLLCGTLFTWIAFFAGLLPGGGGNAASVMIVTFIGLDVLHPCAFLWLGCEKQPVPAAEVITSTGLSGQLQRCCKRTGQLMFSAAFWGNLVRSVVFSTRTTGCIKWIAPLQHAILPVLTIFFPFLGINNVLLLLAATR
jgi:hypothetical protein